MSRIGKQPVDIPDKVDVKIDGSDITVKGPKGILKRKFRPEINFKLKGSQVIVNRINDSREVRSFHGLSRTLLNNMVLGVSQGFEKTLEINGVGYKAIAQGKKLELNLGYSHPIIFPVPAGITIQTPKPTVINISGINKETVGETAAKIRRFRPPEPYKGKGIKYNYEHIIRKEGKRGV